MYKITYSPDAEADLAKLKREEPARFKKAVNLLEEIALHPKTGTGHPEPLKGMPENRWRKHRLIYRIFDTGIHVEILTAYGHYGEK